MPAGLATRQGSRAAAAQVPRIPFTRAALEHVEGAFVDESNALTTATKALGPFDVPAFGYARGIHILVEVTGGTGGTPGAAADAPWNVIQEIALVDVNGGNIVGPFNGYDLFLVNKWGGYAFDGDVTRWPSYVNTISTDGNFTFRLYLPLEVVSRNAFGALPNQNAAATYKLRITQNASGTVYSTAPTTLPTGVRIRCYLDAWSQPNAQDPVGNAQAVRPPSLGTTQYWTKASYSTAVGSNTIRLARVGNFIRTLVFVVRDDNNAREGADAPDPIQIHLDGRIIRDEASLVRRDIMAQAYGYALAAVTNADVDEGVFVYPFSHDFDGKPGGELGDLYLPSVQSSRLELVGTISNTAGTLDVLTNDISPVGAAL